MSFTFQTDDKARRYCERIVEALGLLYDIDPVAGRELLNGHWRGMDLREGRGQPVLLYHETEREWAERLGNATDYTPAGDARRTAGEAEAERRVAEFRRLGRHGWLCGW